MAREPEERYASVEDLARDLHAFLESRRGRRGGSPRRAKQSGGHERRRSCSPRRASPRAASSARSTAPAADALRYGVVRAQPRAPRAALPARDREPRRMVPGGGARRWRSAGARRTSLDRRGSGLNLETEPGDAASAEVLLEDVRRFRAHVGLDALVLVGLSWGGKLALAAALDQPRGRARARPRDSGSRAARRLLAGRSGSASRSACALGGRARFHVPIEPEMFTRTPRYLDYIENDPLRLQRVTRALPAREPRARPHDPRARPHAGRAGAAVPGRARPDHRQRAHTGAARAPPGRTPARRASTSEATHSIQFDETGRPGARRRPASWRSVAC